MHLNLHSWPQQSDEFLPCCELLGHVFKIGTIPASRSSLKLAERMLKFQPAAQLFSHCYSKSIACRSEATSTRLRLGSSSRKPISNNDCPGLCRRRTHRLGLVVGRPHDNIGLKVVYLIPDQHKNPELFVLPTMFPGSDIGSVPLSQQIGTLELMLQLYDQFYPARGTYLEPAITWIPKPSLIGDTATVAAGLRLIKLF